MNLFKRFRSYFIGVLLGMLVVMIVFKDKANLFTSWLPENRVLLELTEKKMFTTPKADCQLKCLGKQKEDLSKYLTSHTSVEFSKSQPQAKPREYYLIQTVDGIKTSLLVTILDSTFTLTEIKSDQTLNCDC